MTRRDLLLNVLEQAGARGVTTAEIIQAGVGSRYGARLLELRERGYVVEAVRVRDGSYRYTLLGGPGRPAACPPDLAYDNAPLAMFDTPAPARRGHWEDVA